MAGPVRVPDSGITRLPDFGLVRVSDSGPIRVPDSGLVRLPDFGLVRVPDSGPVRVSDSGKIWLSGCGKAGRGSQVRDSLPNGLTGQQRGGSAGPLEPPTGQPGNALSQWGLERASAGRCQRWRQRPLAYSSRSVLAIRSRNAACGLCPSYRMLCTAFVRGASTPSFFAMS